MKRILLFLLLSGLLCLPVYSDGGTPPFTGDQAVIIESLNMSRGRVNVMRPDQPGPQEADVLIESLYSEPGPDGPVYYVLDEEMMEEPVFYIFLADPDDPGALWIERNRPFVAIVEGEDFGGPAGGMEIPYPLFIGDRSFIEAMLSMSGNRVNVFEEGDPGFYPAKVNPGTLIFETLPEFNLYLIEDAGDPGMVYAFFSNPEKPEQLLIKNGKPLVGTIVAPGEPFMEQFIQEPGAMFPFFRGEDDFIVGFLSGSRNRVLVLDLSAPNPFEGELPEARVNPANLFVEETPEGPVFLIEDEESPMAFYFFLGNPENPGELLVEDGKAIVGFVPIPTSMEEYNPEGSPLPPFFMGGKAHIRSSLQGSRNEVIVMDPFSDPRVTKVVPGSLVREPTPSGGIYLIKEAGSPAVEFVFLQNWEDPQILLFEGGKPVVTYSPPLDTGP